MLTPDQIDKLPLSDMTKVAMYKVADGWKIIGVDTWGHYWNFNSLCRKLQKGKPLPVSLKMGNLTILYGTHPKTGERRRFLFEDLLLWRTFDECREK